MPATVAKAALSEAGETELARKTTGSAALGPGLSTSMTDFLSPIAAMLGFSKTENDVGDAAFEANVRLPTSKQKLKLQALVRKATLYEALSKALPESTRAERALALEKGLGELDDVRLSATWHRESSSFGRRMESSMSLFNRYFESAVAVAEGAGFAQAARDALGKFPGVLNPACADSPDDVAFTCYQDPDAALAAFGAAIDKARLAHEQLRKVVSSFQVERFVDLVNNQPQLSIELAQDARNELAGPDQTSLKLRYESGFRNVNDLRDKCAPDMTAQEPQRRLADLECFANYLEKWEDEMAKGGRVFVSADLTRRPRYSVTLTSDSVVLSQASSTDMTISAGYGRYLASGDKQGRLDLYADYVWHQDDPLRQNRLVANATYTQRISATLAFAGGLSYSSKPEFLNDVDKKMSANFGIRYRAVK